MPKQQTRNVDIAIIGSGFAGSILAMIARRLGRSVALIERGHHPRFAIGESSTPLASLLIETIAKRYDLPRLLPFTKYGAWTRERPDVACGLKRGFSFFSHERGREFEPSPSHDNQLLVAASPNDDIGDVHWYRPELDHFLVNEAVALGVEYLDGVSLSEFIPNDHGVTLRGTRRRDTPSGSSGDVDLSARFVVDATGPRGFIHAALGLGERELPGLPKTAGLYTHFTGVRRFAEVVPQAFAGSTVLPYPPDAAAVHHIFDGGWIWVLRFDNGITSAGVAATERVARELRFDDGAPAWARLMALVPSVGAQFADATPTRDFIHTPRLSFCSGTITGNHWAMLPSAAGIVDPLLSTGFPLTLLGVERIAAAIRDDWQTDRFAESLARYGAETVHELDVTARLVGALYDSFGDWERFAALTHLYFAAASFAEAERRLDSSGSAGHGRADATGAFLLLDHPEFAAGLERCLALAAGREPSARAALLDEITRTIEPVNVAGLNDASRANWYPCLASDLLGAAGKLGATERDVVAMLERCGFTQPQAAT